MKSFNLSLCNIEFCLSANTATDNDCANIFITSETVYIMPLPPRSFCCHWVLFCDATGKRRSTRFQPRVRRIFFNSMQCQIDFISMPAAMAGEASKKSNDFVIEIENYRMLRGKLVENFMTRRVSPKISQTLIRVQQVNWAKAARLSERRVQMLSDPGTKSFSCNYDLRREIIEVSLKSSSIHQLRLMDGIAELKHVQLCRNRAEMHSSENYSSSTETSMVVKVYMHGISTRLGWRDGNVFIGNDTCSAVHKYDIKLQTLSIRKFVMRYEWWCSRKSGGDDE